MTNPTNTQPAPLANIFTEETIGHFGSTIPALNAAQLRAMADLLEMVGRKVTVEADAAWYHGEPEGCGPISGELTSVYFSDGSVAVNVVANGGQSFHCGPLYGKSVMEYVSGETIARDPS